MPAFAALLAESGCIRPSPAVFEVASDSPCLKLMKKGCRSSKVARVARRFSDAGILVNADR